MKKLEPDPFGDPTPDEVYAAITKTLIDAGAGDAAIYEAMEAVRAVYTKVYEDGKRSHS